MKHFLLLIFISPLIILSQNKKKDLYIAYEDCSIHKIIENKNVTITLELYQIRIGDKVKPKIEYSVNKSGNLVIKDILISGKSYGHYSIIYKNQNNENPIIRIDKSEIKNKIWAKNLIYSEDTDFISLFKNFNNIYLVDYNNKESDIKTAKKIKIEYIPTL